MDHENFGEVYFYAPGEAGVCEALEGGGLSVVRTLAGIRPPGAKLLVAVLEAGRAERVLADVQAACVPFVALVPPDAPELEHAALDRGALDTLSTTLGTPLLRRKLERLAASVPIAPIPATGSTPFVRFRAEDTARVFAAAIGITANGVTVIDVTDPELPLVYVNPAFERMTGYRASEVMGKNPRFLQSDFPAPVERALMRKAIDRGERCTVLLRNRRKDGEAFWNELTLTPIFDDDGRHIFMVGVQNDVTAKVEAGRLSAERAGILDKMSSAIRDMSDRRRLTEAVLNQVTMGVITADPDKTVTFANRQARAMLRLEEVRPGTSLLKLFGDRPDVAAALAAARPEREQRVETTLTFPDATLDVGLAVTRSHVTPHDLAFVVLFADIGQKRQQASELRRVERLSALGQMAAGFAHEVRNPLAAMAALADSLEGELDKNDLRREYAVRMKGLVNRMDNLVRSTLRFSQPRGPQLATNDPATLISEAVEVLRPRLKKLGGQPCVHVDPDLPPIVVDGNQIVEILIALVDNALDSVGAPERVKVVAALKDGGVALDVIDDGPGISPEVQQRIFDPFYTTKPKGIGLGLSIAQRLTAENGGNLLCSSRPGVETRFRLLFRSEPR